MKKTFLTLGLAMAMCVPTYAAEQFTNDNRTAANFPVFGDEDQDYANLGLLRYRITKDGRISRNALKPKIDDPNNPEYVPPELTPAEKKKATQNKGPIPVKLGGDHVEFENATGDFTAVGKVKISQGNDSMTTNYAFGNMKTGDIYLLEGGTLFQPGSRVDGKWMHFNFNNKTGEMKQVTGKGLKDRFKAPHALIFPDKVVADQGVESTRCFAKEHTPCMAIKAKTLEFYPKEKMVAHNVKVYMKGVHIYSRKLWINDFTKDNKMIIKPSVGWGGGTNGFYAKLEMVQPIAKNTTVRVVAPQYSRSGFKPVASISRHEKNYTITYSNGWDLDDDKWYLKQNNWEFKYKPHHFIKGIPLTVSGQYEYGLWRQWDPDNDSTKKIWGRKNGRRRVLGTESWHREYKYYINHDPIKLFGPDTTLHLTYGRKWVTEGLTNETRITNMYYATVKQKVTKQFDIWASYLRERKTSNLFDLGQSDMDKELRVGLQLRPTKNDVFSVVHRYNIGDREYTNHRNEHIGTRKYKTTYNWYHRFCCWALQLTYEAKWYNDKRRLELNYYLYNW